MRLNDGVIFENLEMKLELVNDGFKIFRTCKARSVFVEMSSSDDFKLRDHSYKDSQITRLIEQIIRLMTAKSVPEKITED